MMDEYNEEMEINDIRELALALEDQTESKRAVINESSECCRIQRALDLNKEFAQKLTSLQGLFKSRLIECREKLSELETNKNKKKPQATFMRNLWSSNLGTKPYFTYFSSRPPDNSDTMKIKNSNMYDHYKTRQKFWTINDKNNFLCVMNSMSYNIKHKDLYATIQKLKNQAGHSKTVDLQLEEAYEQLKNIENMDLAELALPINKDYDWDKVSSLIHHRHSPSECSAMWRLCLHPSINKDKWTLKEQRTLENIARKHHHEDWDAIAKELNTNRSGYQCFLYYITYLHKLTAGKWSREEDEMLRRVVKLYSTGTHIDWAAVASVMDNRTRSQLYTRWHFSLRKMKKGRFLPEEDSILLTYVEQYGLDFKKISKYIPGRNIRQLRERYNVLTKNTSAVWTVEEDQMLVQLLANQSNHPSYSQIECHFHEKNRTNIRMRYLTLLKWMKKNPDKHLSEAPRRPKRQLCHGKSTNTLGTAVENLNNKLIQKYKGETATAKTTKEKFIDHIITDVMNDHIQKQNCGELNENNATVSKSLVCSYNLKNLLILQRSCLHVERFGASSYAKQYHHLFQSTSRTYSRKESNTIDIKPTIIDMLNYSSITGNVKYVLPPNYSTITACNVFLSSLTKTGVPDGNNKHITQLCKNDEKFLNDWNKLLDRFQILFTWSMILSNIEPET